MFSEAVDAVIERSGKPNRLGDIVKYINASIRELNGAQFYVRDLIEDEITATASPHVWTHPRIYRKMRTVRYPEGEIEHPPRYAPGKIQQNKDYYYYDADTYTVFKGVGVGDTINVAYYRWLRPLAYYKKLNDTRPFIASYESAFGTLTVRPAIFDPTDGDEGSWTYFDGTSYVSTLGSTALNEAAQAKVANWLLLRWNETVEEGGLAKILKSAGDDRAVSSFALYKSMANQIETNEVFESLDF